MRKVCLALVVATIVSGSAGSAHALLQFYKVWAEVYLTDNANEEYVKAASDKKTQCMLCHQGKNRKNHNPYGEHLAVLLDKREHIRDLEKIKEALAKVGKMHVDPKDEKSKTYDERIKAGELPGGTLEEVLKEPEPKPGDAPAGDAPAEAPAVEGK